MASYRGRCPEHSRERPHVIRSKEEGRIYDRRRWALLRRKRLSLNSICQACGDELARDVDHVVPIEQGGAPFDLANTQALCGSCHSKKTNREVRERSYG
jgi:5-methylcytosine-specific restriction protein A